MDRPSRNRKAVNYSDIQELDEDEDFAFVKAPPNKKARVSGKEPEQKSSKPASRTTSQEAGSPSTNRTGRLSLDDKLYERDFEAALTLSMLRTPEAEVELSPNGKDGEDLSEAKSVSPSLLLSNCIVDANLLGLDKITGECGSRNTPSRPRQAVSRAEERQRCTQQENGHGNDEDYQPTCTPDSESDADFSGGDESDDEEFTVKKAEKKKPNKAVLQKKEKTARPPAPQKDKKPSKSPKSKRQAAASPVSHRPTDVLPVSTTKKPGSSPPVSRPAVSLSPAGGRLPKWNPPAQIGRSPGASQNLQGKSPGQGLRLGLSRLARVKPLHPSPAGH